LTERSLDRFAGDKLSELDARKLKRELRSIDRLHAASVRADDAELISFSSNDYLGLSQHPEVIEASCAATRRHGVGAGASRLVTGNHSLYRRLESQLAQIKDTEDAVVFGSGYLTNVGVIPSLLGPNDLIVMDELCHACLFAGATLAGSTRMTFRHKDIDGAEHLLRTHRASHEHCLILTDGVFSMDGDRAPVAELLDIANRHDAWLMTDDAHGLGVVEEGRGSGFAAGAPLLIPLQMGTLSKAVGAYGGYLCTSRTVADLIRTRARSFIYTTGLPPGTVAAASRALEIIEVEKERVRAPIRHAKVFAEMLGLRPPESAIVPVLIGDSEKTMGISRALETAGFLVVGIRPPTVPAGTARLRITFSAEHSEEDIRKLAAVLARGLEQS
jgi:8-amino-7-oxononanoate synthase